MARGVAILNAYQCECNVAGANPQTGPHLRVSLSPIERSVCKCPGNLPVLPVLPSQQGCRAGLALRPPVPNDGSAVVRPNSAPASFSVMVKYDHPMPTAILLPTVSSSTSTPITPTVKCKTTKLVDMLSPPSADEKRLIQRLAANPHASLNAIEQDQVNRLLNRSPHCLIQARIAYQLTQGNFKLQSKCNEKSNKSTASLCVELTHSNSSSFEMSALPKTNNVVGRSLRNVKQLRLRIPTVPVRIPISSNNILSIYRKRSRVLSFRSTDSSLPETPLSTSNDDLFESGVDEAQHILFSRKLQILRNKREHKSSFSGESGYETCSPFFAFHPRLFDPLGRTPIVSSAGHATFDLDHCDVFQGDTPDNLNQPESIEPTDWIIPNPVESGWSYRFSRFLFDSIPTITCFLMQFSFEFGVANRLHWSVWTSDIWNPIDFWAYQSITISITFFCFLKNRFYHQNVWFQTRKQFAIVFVNFNLFKFYFYFKLKHVWFFISFFFCCNLFFLFGFDFNHYHLHHLRAFSSLFYFFLRLLVNICFLIFFRILKKEKDRLRVCNHKFAFNSILLLIFSVSRLAMSISIAFHSFNT